MSFYLLFFCFWISCHHGDETGEQDADFSLFVNFMHACFFSLCDGQVLLTRAEEEVSVD